MLSMMRHFQDGDKYIILVLDSRPVVFSVDEVPSENLTYGENIYFNLGMGDNTGFYDWMISSNGVLVGVRYYPMWGRPAEIIEYSKSANLRYVETDGKVIDIGFSDGPVASAHRLIEGEWSGNWVYRSSNGVFAVSFQVGALEGVDLRQLKLLQAV